MSPVIKTRDLGRRLTGEIPVTLVENINLEIEQGQFVVITGPSGSGKSSLLYLLGLLDVPTNGKLWLNGEDTSTYDENKRADIRLAQLGYVFQFHFLLPEFTVLENIMLPMQRLKKLPSDLIKTRATELAISLGLEQQMYKLPSQLSGGQSQRVAIARALANEPLLILADEPTGNLDTAASANVRDILKELAHRHNRAVVAVTHEASFSDKADRIIHIIDGKIQDE